MIAVDTSALLAIVFDEPGVLLDQARLDFGDCCADATAASLNCALLFKGEDFARTDIVPALPVQ